MDWGTFDSVVSQSRASWGVLDDELYSLCSRCPDHGALPNVVAKVAIIGRSYATRIEATSGGGPSDAPGGAILRVANILSRHGSELDSLLKNLPADKYLDPSTLEAIVLAHGTVTMWLKDETGGRAPKSFVSKYIHFHRPCAPIYDSYSRKALAVLRRKALKSPLFPYNKEVMYATYWEQCLAFAEAMAEAEASGLHPTVKQMDTFLLSH